MFELRIGQVFVLKKDASVIIDDIENGGSSACEVEKGTKFTIQLIEDFIDVCFEGYGVGVFTEEELFGIIQ